MIKMKPRDVIDLMALMSQRVQQNTTPKRATLEAEVEAARLVVDRAVPLIEELVQLREKPATERDADWHTVFDQVARAIGDHFGIDGGD